MKPVPITCFQYDLCLHLPRKLVAHVAGMIPKAKR